MRKWLDIKKILFKSKRETNKVRCEECWNFKSNTNKKMGWCASYNVPVSPTDRCSYGDKKEF